MADTVKAVIILVIWFAGFFGWISNIIALFHAGPLAVWGGFEILRCIGIVLTPLGAILGYVAC